MEVGEGERERERERERVEERVEERVKRVKSVDRIGLEKGRDGKGMVDGSSNITITTTTTQVSGRAWGLNRCAKDVPP